MVLASFEGGDWSPLFERFANKYMQLGAPKYMFMVEDKQTKEVFICVDSEALALHLDLDFKLATRKPPTTNLAFLVGQRQYFEEALK